MTPRNLVLIIGLLSLAGCSTFRSTTPKAEPGTPLRECQDAAEQDHSLVKEAAQHASVNYNNSVEDYLQALRKQYVQQCMMERGLLPPGGVDKPK